MQITCVLAALLSLPTTPEALLSGRVLDPSGAPVPAARLRIRSSETSLVRELNADSRGNFSAHLPAGRYQVEVMAQGFLDQTRSVQLDEGQPVYLEFKLEIEPVRESVLVVELAGTPLGLDEPVTKSPVPLQEWPQAVNVIPSEGFRDRLQWNLVALGQYLPGVTVAQGENHRDQWIMRGMNTTANFLIDGFRDDQEYLRDLYNVERVEVWRGPTALLAGRGVGGGIVNRITKEPRFGRLRELTWLRGAWQQSRMSADWEHSWNEAWGLRTNALWEQAESFRQYQDSERVGLNPVLAWRNQYAQLRLAYEFLLDRRDVERGVPSYQGRPLAVDVQRVFGSPDQSWSRSTVHLGSILLERHFRNLALRSRSGASEYDKTYQNVLPGSVTADAQWVSLSAYLRTSPRRNLFHQNDVTGTVRTGRVRHLWLAGWELNQQVTNNLRQTGLFPNGSSTLRVPVANPVVWDRLTFARRPTDPFNQVRVLSAAIYWQDHVELSPRWRMVGALRVDRFRIVHLDRPTGQRLERVDYLWAPRLGLVWRWTPRASWYASYSTTFLPSSGDQFGSLTEVTQQMKPEKFANYEAGLKWQPLARHAMTLTAYRLDRTNSRAIDPRDPSRILQTGASRARGVELEWNGALAHNLFVRAGYAWQDARIQRDTDQAPRGARLAQVPRHQASVWARWQPWRRLGLGLGLTGRTAMYAGIDNTVILPGYVRADAAVYVGLSEQILLQFNMENLSDRRYFLNAHGNNNITPGSPRAVRAQLTIRF